MKVIVTASAERNPNLPLEDDDEIQFEAKRTIPHAPPEYVTVTFPGGYSLVFSIYELKRALDAL